MNRSHLHSLSKSLHPQSFVTDEPGSAGGQKFFLPTGASGTGGSKTIFKTI